MKRFNRHPTLSLLVLCMLGLAACSDRPEPNAEATTAAAQGPAFQPVIDTRQTMVWVLEPLADVLWDSAGTIITAEGSTELAPTTDEGWAEVIRAAATLAESGNLLMLPGRSMGDDWDEYATGLISASELALTAAQDQSSDALFDAGGRIYQVCRACHNQYWVKEDE
jgi:hypothetical protein